MNHPASIPATLTTERPQRAQADRPIAQWAFAAVLIAIAAPVLAADASLTPEQHIAVFMQTGMFP
jgi:hypothetical protein